MTALRLVVVGVVAAVLGLAQDFSAAVVKPAAVLDSPSLTPAQQDRMLIERARRVALAYSDNLPNFVCTQTDRTFVSKDGYDWRQTREATAEVQYVDRREFYRNVTINGRPSKKDFRKIAGAGEFGTSLNDLFQPSAWVKFTRSSDNVTGNHDVAIFRYEVANPSYGYSLRDKKPYVNVRHRGLVSIDKATGHVLRYEAREMLGIPSKHPVRQLSHSVDYGYVPIGGKLHLLPVRSRWDTRFARKIRRSDVEWTNCRKFGAESTVEFE